MNNLKINKMKGNFMSINRIVSKKKIVRTFMETDRLKTPFLSWKKTEIIHLIIACVFNGLKLICLEQFVQYLK